MGGGFSSSADALASPAGPRSLTLWCVESVISTSQLTLQTAMNTRCFRTLLVSSPSSISPSHCHTDCLLLSVLLSIHAACWRSRLHLNDLYLVFGGLRGRVSFVQRGDVNSWSRPVDEPQPEQRCSHEKSAASESFIRWLFPPGSHMETKTLAAIAIPFTQNQ